MEKHFSHMQEDIHTSNSLAHTYTKHWPQINITATIAGSKSTVVNRTDGPPLFK